MNRATRSWYAIRSKSNRERILNSYLVDQGQEAFFPVVRVHPVNPRAARERAYFPGYLFVRADLEAVGKSRFQWMPGSLGLVEFGGLPATVPPGFVAQLRRRIAEIQAAGGLVLADLKPGDKVKIVSGPLAGHEAIFDLRIKGSDRVRMLLDMLGRRVRVETEVGNIQKTKA